MPGLPNGYVEKGLAAADEWTLFGVPVKNLSRDELLAPLVVFADHAVCEASVNRRHFISLLFLKWKAAR